MNKHSEYTADRLESARRTKSRVRLLTCAIVVGTVVLAVILTAALIDYWWLLSFAERCVALAIMASLAVFGAVRFGRYLLHPISAKQVALEMEAQRPELGCVVSTAAEYLKGARTPPQEYGPELVAALQEIAAKRLLLVETNYYKGLLYTGSAMAAILLALLAFVLCAPGSATALARVTLPWSNHTYTHMKVEPGDLEMPVGRDLELKSVFTGRRPRHSQLRWRQASASQWQKAAMTRGADGSYSYKLSNLREAVQYQVAGDDAVSPEYTIKTYMPPQVVDFKVQVRYPEYTKMKPVEESDPNLSVLRASQLAFRIACSEGVTRAQLRFANEATLGLASSITNLWTASLKATNDLYYWIDLEDKAGHKGGNDKPFHLKVLPDQKPIVEITEPGMDLRADATNKVPLKISVSDDFGVEDVKLVFQKLSSPSQSQTCTLKKSNPREAAANAEIDLAPLGLKEYELVAYYAEARDNNTLDGPGMAKSPVYFIEYTTKGEPLSQCRGGNGQKINLLVLEKQLIAATTVVEEKSIAERFPELATMQRQTESYAEIFSNSFILSISPPEARTEFAAAITSMNEAAKELDSLKRPDALKSEEAALAHLYEVTRLLPELEAGMCRGQGNCIKIVLEAIEKLKDSQKKQRQEELPKIIAQSRRLETEQAKLADIYRRSESQNATNSASTNKSASPAQANKTGAGKSSTEMTASESNSGGTNDVSPLAQSGAFDKEQQRLGEEAAALSEKLRALSGKDPRVGVALSQNMRAVSRHMIVAAEHMAHGSRKSAIESAGFGLSSLDGLIHELEQLLGDNPKPTDIAAEEYPKEFEPLISEYMRRLSYAR
jgi:Domain of unknown function (DUF4175)